MKNQRGKDQKPTTADRPGEHGGRQNELMKTEGGGTEKRHTRVQFQNNTGNKNNSLQFVYFLIRTFQLVSTFDDS